jgi:3-phosphoshikimate 1-carboxyvinyltransferase
VPANVVRVRQASRLRGRLCLPGDKSITHRALILAALAGGESRIWAGSDGLDCRSTASVLGALGVEVAQLGEAQGGRVDRIVRSPGRAGLRQPARVLDAGNSGTTLRLMAGVLAGLPMTATLDGDASLRRRPMARIIEPLRRMGATLRARASDTLPPVTVVGHPSLQGLDHRTAVPSAQVKSAILLAGLAAAGTITVREAVPTRDHTERMLAARGVSVWSGADDAPSGGGVREWVVTMEGGQAMRPRDERVPGDISAAAFWLVAGACHPDAELEIAGVGLNPSRRAVIDLLRAMGAEITEQQMGVEASEPMANLRVRSSRLEAIEIGPTEVARAIDEIPALCLAAACARGTTRIRGAGELRHKESDRITGIAEGLAALGARVEVDGNDLAIHGGAGLPSFGLRGAVTRSRDDHRLAMVFAIAGLLAAGETSVDGAAAVSVSYPSFFSDLERVRA